MVIPQRINRRNKNHIKEGEQNFERDTASLCLRILNLFQPPWSLAEGSLCSFRRLRTPSGRPNPKRQGQTEQSSGTMLRFSPFLAELLKDHPTDEGRNLRKSLPPSQSHQQQRYLRDYKVAENLQPAQIEDEVHHIRAIKTNGR